MDFERVPFLHRQDIKHFVNCKQNTESSLDEISEVNRTSFVPHDLHSNNSSCKLSEVSTLHSSEATPNKELDSPFTNG